MFASFKAGSITNVLLSNAIKELLKNPEFDYKKYFADNSISDESLVKAIDEVIAANEAIANDIKGGNQGKAGILVGKVIGIVGKGVKVLLLIKLPRKELRQLLNQEKLLKKNYVRFQ